MAKYWGKQTFTHGSFPEVGQKLKTEKREERTKVGITIRPVQKSKNFSDPYTKWMKRCIFGCR